MLRRLCGPNYRRGIVNAKYIALPLLVWRLLDFLNETVIGPIKMSAGKYVLTGTAAAILQLLIIIILFFLVFSAGHAIGTSQKQESEG